MKTECRVSDVRAVAYRADAPRSVGLLDARHGRRPRTRAPWRAPAHLDLRLSRGNLSTKVIRRRPAFVSLVVSFPDVGGATVDERPVELAQVAIRPDQARIAPSRLGKRGWACSRRPWPCWSQLRSPSSTYEAVRRRPDPACRPAHGPSRLRLDLASQTSKACEVVGRF